MASVTTLLLHHDCHSITWRWTLVPYQGAPDEVTGINYMVIDDQKQIVTNYAEFDNGAWLTDIGYPPTSVTPAASTNNQSNNTSTAT